LDRLSSPDVLSAAARELCCRYRLFLWGRTHLTEIYLERFDHDIPDGYAYDFVNAEALLSLTPAQDGGGRNASGMHYRVLYVPSAVRRYTLRYCENCAISWRTEACWWRRGRWADWDCRRAMQM